jgi:hypothetical protein
MGKVHEQKANCRQRYIPGDETVLSPTDKNSSDFDSMGRVTCAENRGSVKSVKSVPP